MVIIFCVQCSLSQGVHLFHSILRTCGWRVLVSVLGVERSAWRRMYCAFFSNVLENDIHNVFYGRRLQYHTRVKTILS